MTTEMEIDALFAEAEAEAMVHEENAVDIDGVPTTMSVQRAGGRSGRFIPVYSSIDGCPSYVLPHMIPTVMRQRNPDGTPMFLRKPTVAYRIGAIKCMLHAEHPSRDEFVGMGLTAITCKKATLRSEYDLERHMNVVHPDEYKLIQKVRAERLAEEEREFRREQMETMRFQRGVMPVQPAPVVETQTSVSSVAVVEMAEDEPEAEKTTQAAPLFAEKRERIKPLMIPCPDCGKDCKGPQGVVMHQRRWCPKRGASDGNA